MILTVLLRTELYYGLIGLANAHTTVATKNHLQQTFYIELKDCQFD